MSKIVLTEKQLRSIFRFCAGTRYFPQYEVFMLEVLRPDGSDIEWLKMRELADEEWEKISKEEK